MTRALITGINSMTGSHLCDHLLASTDWKIYGTTRSGASLDNNVEHLDNNRVSFLSADLGYYVELYAAVKIAKPDFVFHLAAESDTAASFKHPAKFYHTNIAGTQNLLDAIRCADFNPVVHICSSSEIFGRVSQDELPINETCRFHPASPYAISRVGTDLVGKFYAEAYGLRTVITRAFTHTGSRRLPRFAESSFAKQIALIEANKADPVIHVGNLNSVRTWTDVRDMVRAYHLLAVSDFKPGDCFNIGGSFSCSILRMLETLLSLSTRQKIDIKVDEKLLRLIDADLQIPDVTKFHKQVQWQVEIPFVQTMTDLLNYWRERV